MSLPAGLFKLGHIKSITPATNNAEVTLDTTKDMSNTQEIVHDTQILFPFAGNNGTFIGTLPPEKTPVLLLQGQTNAHQIVGYLPTNSFTLPSLKPGEVLVQSTGTTKLLLNQKDEIFLGSGIEDFPGSILVKPDYNLLNINFNYQVEFSQASRHLMGIVKRDNNLFNVSPVYSGDSRLYSDNYDKTLNIVGLDPRFSNITTSIQNQNKNPPFIESRSVIYEFSYTSNIKDLYNESQLYKTSTDKPNVNNLGLNNRRRSRADTLSLTLTDPNYLMESISGTVVDIYGNVLDINRSPLFLGDPKLTLKSENNLGKIDKDVTYLNMMEEHRKGIAYHFELNARKKADAVVSAPGINIKDQASKNYARDRSRFFIDVDKEGQFKINIPASSDTGNVPLLARYENYSTIDPENPGSNPDGRIDVILDSFAAGMSERNPKYKDQSENLSVYNKGLISVLKNGVVATPKDRLYSQKQTDTAATTAYHLKHGTAFHDILATCFSHQIDTFTAYLASTMDKFDLILTPTILTPVFFDIVNPTIEMGSDKPNAGGRSGQINLDGSIELNIGANTVDRQSIWLDTAGGMVANFGRDKNGVSAYLSMDGNVFFQVGGFAPLGDSRFEDAQNAFNSGVLDIRVLTSQNSVVLVRIDKQGVNIMSPTEMNIQTNGNMQILCNGTMNIDAEELYLQKRRVSKSGPLYPLI